MPTVREHDLTLRTSVSADDHSVSWKVKCLNCGAVLAGPFCAECGQRAVPPHPTLRELAGDAMAEFSGWDGKFVETLRIFLCHPGELTRRWLDGQRVAFIAPLRLYLAASLVFFLITATAPNPQTARDGRINIGGVNVGMSGNKGSERLSRAAAKAASGGALSDAERDSALAEADSAPPLLRPIFKRAVLQPVEFKAAINAAMPRVFFALVPVLALIIWLFYRRRHYPEHLYFTMHLMTFLFIARSIGNVVLYTRVFPLIAAAQVVIVIWILAYGFIAFRRVYGGSAVATILKGLGIAALYAVVATLAIVAMALVVTT